MPLISEPLKKISFSTSAVERYLIMFAYGHARTGCRYLSHPSLKVSDWDPATASFPSSKAFLQFVSRAKNKALYETGIDVHEDDHILTLITCDRSYGGVSGRLVVMAVQE